MDENDTETHAPMIPMKLSTPRTHSNRVSWNLDNVFNIDVFLWIPKSIWKEHFHARCVLVVSVRNCGFPCSSRPGFFRSRFTFGNLCGYQFCFSSGSWKPQNVKPWFLTCATLSIQNLVILSFAFGFNVCTNSKAKGSVSWKGFWGSGKWIWCSLWSCIPSSPVKPVYVFNPEPCAN